MNHKKLPTADIEMNKQCSPSRPLDKSVIKNCFSYFSTKTYVVGTPKNRLGETVFLST